MQLMLRGYGRKLTGLCEQQQQQQQLLPALLLAVMTELQQPGFLATWTPQEMSMLLWSVPCWNCLCSSSSSSSPGAARAGTAASV